MAAETEIKGGAVKRVLVVIAIIIVAAIAAAAWYVNDYYRAHATALATMADADGDADGVVVREIDGNKAAFVPDDPKAGLIFYPGAKVQPEAYAPLLERCAEQGILCVLVRPLFNLAILDENAAEGVQAQFPEIDTWIVAGHSMGGVAASDYASHHAGDFSAIAFLASYPTAELAEFDGDVVSVAGSNDEVLNRDNYESARAKLPDDASELEIAGGNHAYYGNYGEQAGDGAATITRDEQQAQTANAIARLAA